MEKVIIGSGKNKISFKKGGLHELLGIPQDQQIPKQMMIDAMSGKYGEKAKKAANFAKNVLTGAKK
jgi:hypothetical protein